MDDTQAAACTTLLVTLTQAVLNLHQVGYVPERLRWQLKQQVAALEQLTQEYARLAAAGAGPSGADDPTVGCRAQPEATVLPFPQPPAA